MRFMLNNETALDVFSTVPNALIQMFVHGLQLPSANLGRTSHLGKPDPSYGIAIGVEEYEKPSPFDTERAMASGLRVGREEAQEAGRNGWLLVHKGIVQDCFSAGSRIKQARGGMVREIDCEKP